jgi:DNA-binding IclR family transcriptional regulator
VAEFLLELAEDFGRRESRGWFIDLIMSQEELATLIGASRQSVNESLRDLERTGLIRRDGRRFVLLGIDMRRKSIGTPQAV